jgi:hypothetical protein
MSTPMTPEQWANKIVGAYQKYFEPEDAQFLNRLAKYIAKQITEALAAQKEADAREIARLKKAATHALGLIVEFANLNGLRNMSDAELGMAVLGVVRELNEVTGGPPWSEARIAEMVRGSQ